MIPIAFQQFMTALVSASDAFMLGFMSQNAMSAVSLAGQVMFIYSLFLYGITMGTSIFSAQYYGKGDMRSVGKILAISLDVSAAVSLIFTLLAICIPSGLMRIFTSDSELIPIGAEYLRAAGISYALLGISQVLLTVMKNCGQAGKSSMISAVSMGVNILLNGIFIYVLGLGVIGAAVATVISKLLELVWAVLEIFRKNDIIIEKKLLLSPDNILFKDMAKTTAPVLANMLVWGCGFTMYSVIMGHMSSDAVAANAIANIVKELLICICSGFASGGAIIVGNELGRGKLEKAKEYGAKLCKIAVVSGILTGILILLCIPFVSVLGELTDTAKSYLRIMLVVSSYYVAGKSVNMTTISGIFCAGGDSRFGFICDTVTMWAVTVPLGLIAAFVLKLPVSVVYILINIDEIVKLPAVYKHYKKYQWVKDLTRKEVTV
jgi:putative MATE family efflux protein